MPRFLLAIAVFLPSLFLSRESRAEVVWGTLVIDFRLEWDGASIGTDGTLYRPHMEYWNRANDSSMDISIEPFLPAWSSPNQNTYWTERFPQPSFDNLPYGGFLAYYKSDLGEGMVVGLTPGYVPVDDFDTLFDPTDFIVGVSEAEALEALKNPIPGTPQTPGSVFSTMVIVNPDIMPRWQYDTAKDTYSLSMDLYAFSTPQHFGSSSSGATFTPVPEPAGLILAVQGGLAAAAFGWIRRRRASRRAAATGAAPITRS